MLLKHLIRPVRTLFIRPAAAIMGGSSSNLGQIDMTKFASLRVEDIDVSIDPRCESKEPSTVSMGDIIGSSGGGNNAKKVLVVHLLRRWG